MSFGDNETELDLTGQDIAVFLGENLDSKSEDARNGVGKAQPLDAKVLTPNGWRLMGDLEINDKVITSGGRAARIAGITDQPLPQPIYAITTVDQRKTRASGNHAWNVLTDMKMPRNLNTFFSVKDDDDEPLQWRTLTTEEILRGLESGHEFHLPLHQPPREPRTDDMDPHHMGMVAENDTTFTRPCNYNAAQRYMYLKGLLGYHKKGKNATMPSVRFGKTVRNEGAAREVQDVVWSLGGYCEHHQIVNVHQVELEVQNPNKKRFERYVKIDSIYQDWDKDEATRCLILAGSDPLYVTDDYIVTHNSTIIDALCFVLFGKVIRDITNQGLINKWVPKKPMYVEMEFNKGNFQYMVERGERPSKLKLYRKPLDEDRPFKKKDGRKFIFDISRGKTETTKQIAELLGYDITLFEYLVANSSKSDPFPKLKPPQQRAVMEKLFGFEILSLKGEIISKQRKETRKELSVAETALSTTIEGNNRIRAQIAELERRAEQWERTQASRIDDLRAQVAKLQGIDYDQEIENLNLLAEVEVEEEKLTTALRAAEREAESARRLLISEEGIEGMLINKIERLDEQIKHMAGGVCPTCNQKWTPDEGKLEALSEEYAGENLKLDEKRERVNEHHTALDERQTELATAQGAKAEFDQMLEGMGQLEINFDTVEAAMEAKNRIQHLSTLLDTATAETNPHTDTVNALNADALQPEDDREVKRLRKLEKHQTFMVKLLTDPDSFIRKKILDQYVPALNQRIKAYMNEFDKPHIVRMNPDLSLEITLHKEQYAWGALSSGESVNISLALNYAFQDIFEFINYSINILCIDEQIDNGLGPGEARSVVEVLKKLNHTKRKSILLITHREDVAAQADRTFVVRKADDLSWVEQVQ